MAKRYRSAFCGTAFAGGGRVMGLEVENLNFALLVNLEWTEIHGHVVLLHRVTV